jgi:Ca2+-binding RTX toxin-like protein
MGSSITNLAISNKSSSDLLAWQFQYNTYPAPVTNLPPGVSIATGLVALPTRLPANQTTNVPLATQVMGSDKNLYTWQLGQRIYITPATETNFYTQNTTITQVPADPFGVSAAGYSWNETPFSSFEYSVDASGNLTYDTSYIDDGSYPITWVDSGKEFGFQGFDLAKAWLASVSFISPSLTQYVSPLTNGDPSDLILRSTLRSNGTFASGSVYPSDGNRLIGPNKLWALTYGGSPLPTGNDPKGNPIIPVGALRSFNAFLAAVPSTGNQLSVANKGGPNNYLIWQNGLPPDAAGSSASLGYPASNGLSPSNGYTYALQRAADAVGGRGLQPGTTNGKSASLWQSFFSYPQENIYSQTTESAGSITVQQVNVYPLTSPSYLVGSADHDIITGTSAKQTIVGGLGGDRLTGGGGADTFLYLTLPSSATSKIGGSSSTIDTITDFNPANDFIDLRQVDRDLSGPTSPYPGFEIIFTSGGFTGRPGSLTFTRKSTSGSLDLDANGDMNPDFTITLAGVTTLSPGAWLLA